jgi:hypothetical protein
MLMVVQRLKLSCHGRRHCRQPRPFLRDHFDVSSRTNPISPQISVLESSTENDRESEFDCHAQDQAYERNEQTRPCQPPNWNLEEK